MILQALKEYYDRKAADPESNMAAPGFEWKEIPYIITLNGDGTPISLSSTYEGEGKQKRAKKYVVPQGVKRASSIQANILWDNPEYALGVDLKGRPERVIKQHESFFDCIRNLDAQSDAGIAAVVQFLSDPQKIQSVSHLDATLWASILESGANLTFRLSGDSGIVLERPDVMGRITRAYHNEADAVVGLCLVSGDNVPIERLHAPIKGVRDAQSTGANIVSFNLKAFESYQKKQGDNAPVGKAAAFAYTTGLNHLLGRDSKQRLLVGDATTVFWAERPAELEGVLLDIFDEPPKDDPDRGVNAVKSLYKAVEGGVYLAEEQKSRFFILGLAPNAGRISIRFWNVDTVQGISTKIVQHFDDLEIVHGPKDKEVLSLFRLLVSTAAQGKSENIPPNLAGDTMRSILSGHPYPYTLLQALVRRTRADHEISYVRASLIKACINRKTRFEDSTNREEILVSLDTTNVNGGYRLGRLFATLEKIQAEANPGINATIRDRFYGAASGTPVAVFSNLMRLKNHHLAKLESKGRQIFFEKLIAEIMDAIIDFPPHLSLADQGRFAIGYYHQNQSFYTKKDSNKSTDATEGDITNE